MKKKTKKKAIKKPIKYTATIVDKQVVWKNLKLLKGDSFLMKLNPMYKGKEYIIENNLDGDITILEADEKGMVLSWTELSKQFIEDDGYEIV